MRNALWERLTSWMISNWSPRETVILFIGITGLFTTGCDKREELFNGEELIFLTIKDIDFYEDNNSIGTFEVTFLVDHQYDYGLKETESFPPYDPMHLVIDVNDVVVKLQNDVTPPFYTIDQFETRQFFSATDNRPPYNCNDYLIVDQEIYYIHHNPYYYNLLTDFMDKDGNLISFNKDNCPRHPFYARVGPEQSSTTSIETRIINQYRMEVTFKMSSLGFTDILGDEPFVLQAVAIDKELNISDTTYARIERLADLK